MRKLSRQLNRFGEYPPIPQLDEIQIRTQLNPGDLIQLIQLHGEVYRKEYQYDDLLRLTLLRVSLNFIINTIQKPIESGLQNIVAPGWLSGLG
ncbi:MAG: hypothetical protein R2806_20670 [Saprospiraceae bacterium]